MTASASDEIIEVTVTLNVRGAGNRLDEIVRVLEKQGLADAVLHARFGIVNGRVPSAKLPALQQVPGVLSVRQDRTYRVQPK